MKIFRYIKNDVFHPLSFLGVLLLGLALWTCGDGLIRTARGQSILEEYVSVDGVITQSSEVEISKKMGAPTYYYQNFTLTYVYDGEVYDKY